MNNFIFREFLQENNNYDEKMNLYLLGSYRLCTTVHFLCNIRGLYVDTAAVLTNMLEQNQNDELKTLHS